MSKKLYFLMCFVLVLTLSGAAQATAIDDCRYNLSFELMIDPCDPNNGCGNLVCGHTSTMDDVLAWEMSASFAGVDVNAPHNTCGDDRDWGIIPDGNSFGYMQSGKSIYQVLDPAFDGNAIITAGRKYTLTFDGAVNSTTPRILAYSFFYGDDFEANQITSDSATVVFIEHPSGKGDWSYDLTLGFVAQSGQPYLGKTLGIMFDDPAPNTWLFVDDVRVDWIWATSAFAPSPADGAEDVPQDANLTWTPGLWADRHIVYFSTDVNEVSTRHQDANKGIQDANLFDPSGELALGGTYYWAIDEVNQAFVNPGGVSEPPWLGDVWSFEVTGPATNPNPADGAENVSLFTKLSWTPGTDSNSHDVYFGTSEAAVTDANIDVNFGVYMVRQDANDFNDFVPALELSGTYYWRIDEVNEAASTLIKGKLWSFTVANYLVVDDMDSYPDDTAMRSVWTTGHLTGNGAEIFVSFGTIDANLVRDGNSMRFTYMNFTVVDSNYVGSEAVANTSDLESGSDWTKGDAKALVLYFFGDAGNGTDHDSGYDYPISQDQMYVAVEDGDGNVGILKYPDMNDIKEPFWHEWNIELAEPRLDDVNVANVAKVYIGFGGTEKTGQSVAGAGELSAKRDTVWFDDIRLYPPRCVPVFAHRAGSFEAGNFGNAPTIDCISDLLDLRRMSLDWLITAIGNVTPVAPNSTSLVGYWTMDDDVPGGGSKSDVVDSSGNANHGLLYDDIFQGAPKLGATANHQIDFGVVGGALSFDGFDDYIEIPVLDLNSNTVTMSAWIKRAGELPIYAGIVFSSDANSTAGLSFGSTTAPDWLSNHELAYFWDGNSPDFDWMWQWHSGLIVPDNIWSFVALVVEPTKATIYLHDGIALSSATNYADHFLEEFDGVIRFADQMQEPGRFFKGVIDDVHIYNRSLSPEEILGLAGLSGTHYLALEPWRADANDDDKVDFHDYVIMANNWLKEILWPFE